MVKSTEVTEKKSSEKKIVYKGKSQKKKINPTPKKKKTPQPPQEKKRREGYNDPFPATVSEQVDRMNNIVRAAHPEKADLELRDSLVAESHFLVLEKPSFGELKKALIDRNINFRSNEGLTNCPRVIILTLSSERALELGTLIEDDFEIPQGEHPLLLSAHGGGRKADQITRQKDALKKGLVPVAIGTPGRVLRLCQEEQGYLNLASLAAEGGVVVFDMEYDLKQRDVMGMVETRKDLAPLLGLEARGLVAALRSAGSKLKLALVKEWDD